MTSPRLGVKLIWAIIAKRPACGPAPRPGDHRHMVLVSGDEYRWLALLNGLVSTLRSVSRQNCQVQRCRHIGANGGRTTQSGKERRSRIGIIATSIRADNPATGAAILHRSSFFLFFFGVLAWRAFEISACRFCMTCWAMHPPGNCGFESGAEWKAGQA